MRFSLVEFQLELSQFYRDICLEFLCPDRSKSRVDQGNVKDLHNILHLLRLEVTIISIIHFCLNKKTTFIKIMHFIAGAAITKYQLGGFKPQKFISLQSLRLEVKDQGPGRACFLWGLSSWPADGHSLNGCSHDFCVCVHASWCLFCMSKFLLLIGAAVRLNYDSF